MFNRYGKKIVITGLYKGNKMKDIGGMQHETDPVG